MKGFKCTSACKYSVVSKKIIRYLFIFVIKWRKSSDKINFFPCLTPFKSHAFTIVIYNIIVIYCRAAGVSPTIGRSLLFSHLGRTCRTRRHGGGGRRDRDARDRSSSSATNRRVGLQRSDGRLQDDVPDAGR